MEAKITGYVARDADDSLFCYKRKPIRIHDYWKGHDYWGYVHFIAKLDNVLFPDLKWEDEPLKVEITIKEVK